MSILNDIQQHLKAPKSQYNSFGKYSYRNCEDILEAVKPLLGKNTLVVSDEVVLIGDRYYVKATAELLNEKGESQGISSAFARETLEQKGMNDAQITGSTSSYARKYALNGLFLIDDTKDDDSREPKESKVVPPKVADKPKSVAPTGKPYEGALANINISKTLAELESVVVKINSSKLLTKKEKEDLINVSVFKSQELSTPSEEGY